MMISQILKSKVELTPTDRHITQLMFFAYSANDLLYIILYDGNKVLQHD